MAVDGQDLGWATRQDADRRGFPFDLLPDAGSAVANRFGKAPHPATETSPPMQVTSETALPDDRTPLSGTKPYPDPSTTPTQAGPNGIRFDFNAGARLTLPKRARGRWQVVLRDLETHNVLFQTETEGAFVSSAKRYFVPFGVSVSALDEDGIVTSVFSHTLDLRQRKVLIHFPLGTLGDTLAWLPYAARFAERHDAQVTCCMSGLIIPVVCAAYPFLQFATHEACTEQKLTASAYATYHLGLFFNDDQNIHQPTDFRMVGLHKTAAYILGVDPSETAPRISIENSDRPIEDPYVCIAVQASTQSKYWNNPYGWPEVVAFLKQNGFRVVCIDQKAVNGSGIVWNHIPHGAENQTGDRPLAERARWLQHAAFFIGLSSGLSWLAWAAGIPVVMISGFTHPTNEFCTPFRIVNWHACNACWNDPKQEFDHGDFLWCPRHKDTPRQFECTRLITAAHVIETIKRIPGFAERSI